MRAAPAQYLCPLPKTSAVPHSLSSRAASPPLTRGCAAAGRRPRAQWRPRPAPSWRPHAAASAAAGGPSCAAAPGASRGSGNQVNIPWQQAAAAALGYARRLEGPRPEHACRRTLLPGSPQLGASNQNTPLHCPAHALPADRVNPRAAQAHNPKSVALRSRMRSLKEPKQGGTKDANPPCRRIPARRTPTAGGTCPAARSSRSSWA